MKQLTKSLWLVLFLVNPALSHAQIEKADLRRIRELMTSLNVSRVESERVAAAKELANLGPDGKEAVSALVEALSDPSILVRIGACDALAAIGPEARAAVPKLAAALADQGEIRLEEITYLHQVGPSVRSSAAGALCSIGKDAAAAVLGLIQAMRIEQSFARRQDYIDALIEIGPKAIPALARALGDAETPTRIGAACALQCMGDDVLPVLPELVRQLGNEAEYTTIGDYRTIGNDIEALLVALGAPALPALSMAMNDPSLPPSIRTRAAMVLTRIQPGGAGAAIPILIEGLKHADVRGEAAAALGDLGHHAKTACSALAAAAQQDDFHDIACAALARIDPAHHAVREALKRFEAKLAMPEWRDRYDAVGAMRGFGATAVPLLLRALKDSDFMVSFGAVYELGEIGAAARIALPDLIQALNRDNLDRSSSDKIVVAIQKIGLDRTNALAAIPILLKLLESDITHYVAIVMGQIGGDVVPELIQMLADDRISPTKHGYASRALGEIGAAANAAVPLLIRRLSDPKYDVGARSELIEALGRIGPAASPAVPALISALTSDFEPASLALSRIGKAAVPALAEAIGNDDPELRTAVLRAISEPGSNAREAVPRLIEVVQTGDEPSRLLAITALGRIGRDASAGETVLIKSLTDPRQTIRASACEALGRIGQISRAAFDKLVIALRDDALAVRWKSAEALGQRSTNDAGVLIALESARKAETFDTVRVAIERAILRLENDRDKQRQR